MKTTLTVQAVGGTTKEVEVRRAGPMALLPITPQGSLDDGRLLWMNIGGIEAVIPDGKCCSLSYGGRMGYRMACTADDLVELLWGENKE